MQETHHDTNYEISILLLFHIMLPSAQQNFQYALLLKLVIIMLATLVVQACGVSGPYPSSVEGVKKSVPPLKIISDKAYIDISKTITSNAKECFSGINSGIFRQCDYLVRENLSESGSTITVQSTLGNTNIVVLTVLVIELKKLNQGTQIFVYSDPYARKLNLQSTIEKWVVGETYFCPDICSKSANNH